MSQKRPSRTARPPRRQAKFPSRAEANARLQIASEAARIMAEDGVRDFQKAKRKAAHRLNLDDTAGLPTNQEVDAALREHIQLFHSDLPETLGRLRRTALEAMRFLAEFDPRLVGPVLAGTVTRFTDVQLHVTADSPEELVFFLDEHRIPYAQSDKRLRFGGDRFASFPCFHFKVEETGIELCVFSPESARETPLSPVDGKPMRRANIKEVDELAKMF